MYEKLQANRDKYTAGTENEEFSNLLKEANDILSQVKGTQEAIEDAKMFRLLCRGVRAGMYILQVGRFFSPTGVQFFPPQFFSSRALSPF